MNLVIDIGNTRVKAALFEKAALIRLDNFHSFEIFLSLVDFEKNDVKACIVSSVQDKQQAIFQSFLLKRKPLIFTAETPIPLANLYKSPETLGSDRLAAAVGAANIFPNKNVLNVDSGTCLKYNFVERDAGFLGGAISPGLEMRLQAMHHFTAGLPLVELDPEFDTLIGMDTQSSILSGALTAACAEVDGIIDQYKLRFPDLTVVVSGGDTDFFVKRLKNSTFARPNLVVEGLNHILDYNVNK